MIIIDYTGSDDFTHTHYSTKRCVPFLNLLFKGYMTGRSTSILDQKLAMTRKVFAQRDTDSFRKHLKNNMVELMSDVNQKQFSTVGSSLLKKLLPILDKNSNSL